MFNAASMWKLCEYSIASVENRFSNEGKILKSMWMLGPSKAVLSNGKFEDAKQAEENTNQENEPNKEGENPTEGEQNKEQAPIENSKESPNETQSADKGKESYLHHYSILEAFSNMYLVYERGNDNSSSEIKSKFIDAVNKMSNKANSKQSSDSKQNTPSEETDKKSNNDVKSDEQDTNDNKDKQDPENQPKEDEENKFEEGEPYAFNIGIDGEGFTEWVVAIDKRADANAVKAAIKSKKFKQAYQIASLKTKSDGLVPLSCTTYIEKAPDGKKNIQPPFIGRCRYAIDSGSEGELDANDNKGEDDEGGHIKGARDTDIKEGLTLCLAVAPINGRTKKADEDVVIQAVYNVTGDITGGVIGRLAASATAKIRDKALGTDSNGGRYRDSEDKDSEENQSDQLSDWLHKKFRCVGDHTMYNNFKKLREFIKKQVAAGNLELEALFVGKGKADSRPINAQVSTFFKAKKFAAFF